jgi:hypothetical protein
MPSGRDGRGRTPTKETHMTSTHATATDFTGAAPDETRRKSKPSHIAYQVRDRDGQKGFWTRIGSAWAHADGKGFNIQIECVPLDGRISLRTAEDKPANS